MMDVGVDVGGTFTDFVGFRAGDVVTLKLPTTRDPAEAVGQGIRALGARGMAHGTTVATNAILQRKGARTAFVTTAGFEDLLTIGRQDRPSLYDLRVTRPEPPVPRGLCFGLRERLDASGRVLRRPSRSDVDRVARAIRRAGTESVAVSLLFSFRKPDHERLLAKALRGLAVSMSHEVLPEFREYERSCTTALDAYVKPLVANYLVGLRKELGRGFDVMKSSGGRVSHNAVQRRPVDMVLSGPAGGVAAAASVARLVRRRGLLTFDMGGTSADFSVLQGGTPTWTTEARIDTFPIAVPVVDIESVGAGGGSLAWIDAGGALRVGPQSAGADPGPMAYRRGGTQVTVTDADLVGGVLGSSLLGGKLPLDVGRARGGAGRLAKDLRLSIEDAVLGVQHVVRASMIKAMRLILARRGLDPKEFALLAFGGAGPMHAAALARELGIRSILVPFLPGAFSAYGILISPIRLEYGQSLVRPLTRSGPQIRSALEAFRDRAARDLEAQGHDVRRATFDASVDMRFRGQSYEINVPMRGDLASAFRREHRRRFGYASRTEPIEVVTVRLVAALRPSRPTPRPRKPREETPGHREVLFDDGWHEAAVVSRAGLGIGSALEGPAVIEEEHATTLVPPDARVRVEPSGLLAIEVLR